MIRCEQKVEVKNPFSLDMLNFRVQAEMFHKQLTTGSFKSLQRILSKDKDLGIINIKITEVMEKKNGMT